MDNNEIISKINTYLHESATALVNWLGDVLPRVADSWWQDCVIDNLSYTQRAIATEKGYDKLSDFDLAALLRITNKSWYDMRTVLFLPSSERECVKAMIGVRNNWAHCSAELPDKDTILNDLKTIHSFMLQLNCSPELCADVLNFIKYIELPESISSAQPVSVKGTCDTTVPSGTCTSAEIGVQSLVYLVSSPEKKGVVLSVTDMGGTTKYDVFVDGAFHTYYDGQIALVEESSGYDWVDIYAFRSGLTAYQINNPSNQNLYSLNSARIDFVPYQFRPALKLLHSDEPRLLIADSVGVGKTIEAGLIIKELEARTNLEKILIICPRPLVAERKWELEMKRFDEEFIQMDGPTLRQAISDTDRDGEWPVRYNKVIVPYSILDSRTYNGESKTWGKNFGLTDLDPAPHFDLVIIDEAHHLRNGSIDKEKAYAYKCAKLFCDHADSVVMLTATPLQTGNSDLFTLLNLLRPDVVIDQKTFELMSAPNTYINRCSHIIRSAGENWAEDAANELIAVRKTHWGNTVISENPLYDDILFRLEKDHISREERVRLISDVESLHSFSTMLNRTRRKDIQDFCVRRSHTIETEFTDEQRALHDELLRFEEASLATLHDARSVPFMMSTIKRQAASCIFGLAPSIRDFIERRFMQINDDPESPDISDADAASSANLKLLAKKVLALADDLSDVDPKFDAMVDLIQEKQSFANNKIMIFSTFRHTLAYLKKRLREFGLRVDQIDGSVPDEQRYALKERFELPKDNIDAIDVLLFTEVGSEGLDYQFCNMMINYDLPWNPMRIEQRIGRIDRRGQLSESVNIYNMITAGTVDADIYYRCLSRIGVFEESIGECDEILGAIASQIEQIAVDSNLSEDERCYKLEQMADNEIRKIQEMGRLEDEEKELFGFDLSEFTTSQEIKKAENPWISPSYLMGLIQNYLHDRVGEGTYFLGEGPDKTIRLSVGARRALLEDSRKLSGGRTMLKRQWESYLSGRTPNHPVTFDPESAERNRDSFFITSLHPLAKQAAAYFESKEESYVNLEYYSDSIPSGTYLFGVYAWKYVGPNSYSHILTICENDTIAQELPDILQNATSIPSKPSQGKFDWTLVEQKQIEMWKGAKTQYRIDVQNNIAFKRESLANNHRNRIRSLEQRSKDSLDESIRRMYQSEIETANESYEEKLSELEESASRIDIHTFLLGNGLITIRKE